MFYFLLFPGLTYNWILVAAAVIPAIFLMVKVYRSDRIEKESGAMARSLIVMGILSTMLAMVEERIGEGILNMTVSQNSDTYNVILYFGIVGLAEESSKYLLMKKRTWRSPEFNCQYDGVVYAVLVSLGFALWENINYVLSYGFGTAIVRALTAIPGHASFGVFMGVFYGAAKRMDNAGRPEASRFYRICSVVIPMLIHGAYDYIATSQASSGSGSFVLFVVVLFGLSFLLVQKTSQRDRYIR